jgi:outer membrane lipoprotein-sorting protein
MRQLNALLLVFFFCCPVLTLSGQKKTQESPGSAILQKVAGGTEAIRDFVATIEATVDMDRLRVPKMKATLYFKKPDKVHFDSPGFAMLPREGVVLNAATLHTKYDATVLGDESVDGKKLLKLQLTGKEQTIRPRQLLVWVDQAVWAIAKMESVPYQGRVLRLEFTYAVQSGGYLLPQTLKASFESTARDSTQRPLDIDMPNAPQLGEFNQRAPRSGSITVKYLEYRINTGLSDEIFEKKENTPKSNEGKK